MPIAPVRANVRGTRDDQAIWMLTVCPGRDRRGERHLGHRPIVYVAIVRRDEAHRRRHVDWRAARADELQAGDINPPPVRLRTLGQLRKAHERDLAHPRRARVPPRVVIEVEAEASGRNGRGVAPGEELLAGERPARRIEAGGDRVARVARRPRLLRRGSDDRRTRRVAPPWLRRRRLPVTAGEQPASARPSSLRRPRRRRFARARRNPTTGGSGLKAQGSSKPSTIDSEALA